MTFNNLVEKYNEKMSMWSKIWLVIDTPGLYLYEKKPITKNEVSNCKEYISFEKITIKAEKEYRRDSMRKSNVIQFKMNKFSLSKSNVNEMNYIILISFKNESLFEQANSVLIALKRIKPTIQNVIRKKSKPLPRVIETERDNSKLSRNTIMSTIGDRENETIETNFQKFSRMNTKKENISPNQRAKMNISNKSATVNQLNKEKNNRKQRTKSCFDFNSLTHENMKNKAKEEISSNQDIIQQKEENMSLCALLNQMLSSSSKKSQTILIQSNIKSSTEISSSSLPSVNQTKRKEQLNSIINMNLNKSIEESFLDYQPVKQPTFNINSHSNEQSYFEPKMLTLGRKDSEEMKEASRISCFTSKLDKNEVFIYDSFLLKKFRKEYNITEKEFGQLFTQSNNNQIKAQLLTEMIGLLSKRFLKSSITKSLEVVLKEKDMNKYYLVSSSHQHSIEYCIVDVFNSFLGNNHATKELYNKVLPKYLKEIYGIDFALIKNIRKRICFPNLFIIMEYHCRVYFNSNREINFSDQFPFQSSNIKYISPYFINKLHLKACDILSSITLFHNDDDLDINSSSFLTNNSHIHGHRHSRNNSHSFISTTNAKRFKTNFEMKQSKQTQQAVLVKLKRHEEVNDNTRISLVKEIYRFVCEKNYSHCLKLCDFYIQRFSDTIFLNSFVYLFLADVYNETNGIDYSKLFIDKTKDLMKWLYPDNNCFFIADCYYTFSLIFLKQSDSYIKDHVDEIHEYLHCANELFQKYYKSEDEQSIKIRLQMIIFKLSYHNSSEFIRKDYQTIIQYLDYFHLKQDYSTEIAYLDLFIDLFRSIQIKDDSVIKELLQRIHVAKKNDLL